MKNWKLIVVGAFVTVAIISYVASEVYAYTLKTEQINLEAEIAELEAQYDDLVVKKNMLSSRDSVQATHPELKYNDNIFYLEPYNE